MQEVLIAGRRTALSLALAAFASPSQALELGPVEVRSAIGERLDARIPLRAREGEWFHATCLALAPDPSQPSQFALPGAALSVERRRASANLRVRTAQPVNEPALAFSVTSTCAGAAQPLGGVTVLLDPKHPGARASPPVPARVPPSPAPRIARAPQPGPRPAQAAADPPRVEPAIEPRPPAAPESAARATGGPRYVLRLTSAPIDLSRARQFDEQKRAVLRERLRLLDNDDQVAAMLSTRDNLRRLEARVTELQLKLAAMPQSFAQGEPRHMPEAPKAAPPPVVASAPAEKPPAAAANPPAPAQAPTTQPQPSAAVPGTKAATEPVKAPPAVEGIVGALESATGRAIAAGVAILALLALLAGWAWMRWRSPPEEADEAQGAGGGATVLLEREPEPAAPIEVATPIHAESAAPVRPHATPARAEIASDASLATRLDEDTELLRRRYIEERFPEIRGGSITLDDPASVVKGARLFYEDGAVPRAVELLRFAIEDRPGELRPWLALFEIYRLERLAGEYGELAGRFRDRHGAAGQWAKVCSFGREIDPGNPLYQEAPARALETIGPREARRLAAADPIAENWLEAPMDFENEVLATELRRSLMSRAGVDERDLVPNPMPALRSVEMFSVG